VNRGVLKTDCVKPSNRIRKQPRDRGLPPAKLSEYRRERLLFVTSFIIDVLPLFSVCAPPISASHASDKGKTREASGMPAN
jgi:hypothetical protein